MFYVLENTANNRALPCKAICYGHFRERREFHPPEIESGPLHGWLCLSDPTRLDIARALVDARNIPPGPGGAVPSDISHHLKILRDAGIPAAAGGMRVRVSARRAS